MSPEVDVALEVVVPVGSDVVDLFILVNPDDLLNTNRVLLTKLLAFIIYFS
jgi:hypothetical protein